MKHILIVLILFTTSFIAFSQRESLKINAGYSIWQGFHKGIDIYKGNYSLGIDFGSGFNTGYLEGSTVTVALDNQYHFNKKNSFGKSKTALALGLIYCYRDNDQTIRHTLQVTPTVAKMFQFSKRYGISLNAGFAITVYSNTDKPKVNVNTPIHFIMPEFKAELFRFPKR